MKRIKRVGLMIAMLMILLQTVGFATSDNISITEYDPQTMTFEERAKWVEENVEPAYSGQAEKIYRNEWLHTSLKTDIVGNDFYDVGKLETRLKFMCNSDFTRVDDFSNVTFEATHLSIGTVDTDYFSKWFAPDNVRVVYEAWFSDHSGAYLVEHWYNLHGSGAYDVRVVKGGPY